MKYTMTTPCKDCPFTMSKKAFTDRRLREFSSGAFPCHKTAELNEENGYEAKNDSIHCVGALIYLEKRNAPNQMMRISERLGMYDHRKLNMNADVR